MSTTTMFVSSLLFSSISSVSGTSILGNTGATGPAATTGAIGQISFTAGVTGGGTQSITASASLAIVTWLTSDSTQTSGNPGLSYNFGSNPAGTFTNTTTGTLPVNIEYTLNLSATSGGYSAIGLNGSTLIYGGTFNDTNGFSNSCIILVPAGGYFGIYYQDNATVTVLNTSRIICTVVNVGGAGPTGPTGPQGQAIQASYAADGTQTGVFSSGTYVAVRFPTITSSQTQGTIPFTYNSGTGLFTNTSGITQLVLVEYSLSLNTTGGGYSAIGLNGVANLFGGMYNDSNFVSNSCSVLVPNNQTIGLYYVDNAGSAVTVQSGTAITFTLINAGAQGPTGSGAGMWSTTSSTSPYNTVVTYSAGYVGMGMGPSGPSFLQANVSAPTTGGTGTAATGGTGSSIPQNPLDVAGTIRSAANQFMDGSTMVSASSMLDYSTFGQNWIQNNGIQNGVYTAVAMSANGQYQTVALNTVGIFYSNNYGITWNRSTSISTGTFNVVTMSASGQYQIITTVANGIYYSSNYGQTWVLSNASTSIQWYQVCISASGQYASVCAYNPAAVIYLSTNYGQTWILSSSVSAVYQGLACSASGQYQVAGVYSASATGTIYYSSNYGQSWTASNTTNAIGIQYAGMSASGQYATLVSSSTGGVYVSSNYGATFIQIGSMISNNLSGVAMSASGQYQITAGYVGGMYYSTNYGVTWVRVSSLPIWYSMAMSANGQYCIATGYSTYGALYSSVTQPPIIGTSVMGGNVGMGLGPTGSSFLQTNFGSTAATGGTGSNAPQYTLDIVGSERVNGARLFPDNSAQITATPALDYNTFGLNWAATNASVTVSAIGCAISATGQIQIQVSFAGVSNVTSGIYYSINYGQTWIQASGTSSITWVSCAISASGQYAVATAVTNNIYVSSNFGVSWLPTTRTSSGQTRCAISASGQYMIAGGGVAGSATPIYVSSNYGVSWVSAPGTTLVWNSFAMSASGQYMYAGTSSASNSIYISTNYGQSWTPISTGFNTTVFSISSSASGQYVCCSDTVIGTTYYSSTYGQTWTRSNIPLSTPYAAIAMSASGQYVVACGGTSSTLSLYYSTNYGQAFTLVGATPTGNWYGVAMSANAQYLLAANIEGSFWQSITRSPPMFINGSSQITGNLNLTGAIQYNGVTITTGTGSIWTAGGSGVAYYNSGSVGIGITVIPARCPLYVYSNVGDLQWEGRGYFGSATSGFVCGNYAGGVLIGGHNAALTAWANMRTDSNFGMGVNPSFQLHLSSDSAAKASTNTWTISSDERLKDSIVLADNTRCIEIIKAVPLKYYKWKDNVYTTAQVKDRSKLGWIAQDVEKVFPKAVGTTRFVYNQVFQDVVNSDGTTTKQLVSENVIEDCKDLNADQLYAVMYGAVQKLIGDNEIQATQLASQATQLASQATQITSLQTQVDQLLTRLTAAGIP